MDYLMFLLVAITVIAFLKLLRAERSMQFMEMKGVDTVAEQMAYWAVAGKVAKLKFITVVVGIIAMILMLVDLGMYIHGQL